MGNKKMLDDGKKITVKDVFDIFNNLRKPEIVSIPNTKLSYAILKNIRKLDSFLSQYRSIMPEKIEEMNQKLRYAKTKEEKESINKEYEVDIASFNTMMFEKEEELKKIEVEIDLHEVKFSDLPPDLTAKQLEILNIMIKEK